MSNRSKLTWHLQGISKSMDTKGLWIILSPFMYHTETFHSWKLLSCPRVQVSTKARYCRNFKVRARFEALKHVSLGQRGSKKITACLFDTSEIYQ